MSNALPPEDCSDVLLIEEDERGPADDLRFQFEALARLDERGREVVLELLEGMLIKHDAEQDMNRPRLGGKYLACM